MVKKYTALRLEKACERAVFFHNYEYHSIRSILEKEIDKQEMLFEENVQEKQLTDYYAINIKDMLKEIARDGNICAN
jgi:hypothetical protein